MVKRRGAEKRWFYEKKANNFSDTYSINKYNPVVSEYLQPKMQEYGVAGDVTLIFTMI